jgi:hypothetical protein
MNNEFKKINNNNITRYVLEDGSSSGATSGGTSAGSISSFEKPMGGIQRRAGDDLIHQENKKSYKVSHKPKNPVAKAHQTVGTGSGAHTDKTKVIPRKEKHKKSADMTMENFNAEYDDEAGMAYGSLHTLKRAVDGLMDTIDNKDNLPEWCQEKISLAEDYLVTVWDYLQSEKEQGVAEGSLEEVDRRGFLKGIGAVAVAGAAGNSMSAPFKHSQNVDPMTDKVTGKNSTVISDDGTAELYVEWKGGANSGGAWMDLKSGRVHPRFGNSGFVGRIKFGNDAVQDLDGVPQANYKTVQLGGSASSGVDTGTMNTAVIAKKILKHSGKLKIEIPMLDGNKKVFVFTIEQDSTTKIKEQGVAEDDYTKSVASKLAEKLDPNAEPEVWVQDFQKANPNKYHQFKNKTPQKKAQMAVAARRDARLKK